MRPPSVTAVLTTPELGARLRDRRTELGLTQREAAERIGVSKRGYLAWERAESNITAGHLDALLEVLDISEDWIRAGSAWDAIPEAGPAHLIGEVHALLVDPPASSDAFVVAALRDIQGRLERVEAALRPATPSADDPPPAPAGELGRRLRERETTEQDPNAPGSAQGKDSRRGSA